MPLKSQAQRRKFHAMVSRGEISPGTVKKWEAETPKGKLPERLHKKASFDSDQILWAGFFDELEKNAALGALAKGVWGAVKKFAPKFKEGLKRVWKGERHGIRGTAKKFKKTLGSEWKKHKATI